MKLLVSWADVHLQAKNIASDVIFVTFGPTALGPVYPPMCEHIQCVVGISRGGLVPAVILSHELDIPLVAADYSSPEGAGDDKRPNFHLPNILVGPSILIIDDICDTGRTLFEVADHYRKEGHDVHTAALYYKESSPFAPDFFATTLKADAPWLQFPWEISHN